MASTFTPEAPEGFALRRDFAQTPNLPTKRLSGRPGGASRERGPGGRSPGNAGRLGLCGEAGTPISAE
eukprot:15442622-Alexandrium_andersonii.AAC.1